MQTYWPYDLQLNAQKSLAYVEEKAYYMCAHAFCNNSTF